MRETAKDPNRCRRDPGSTVRSPFPDGEGVTDRRAVCPDTLAALRPRPADAAAERRVTALVCNRAGRGLELGDPAQLAAAAYRARPVLEALGLIGETNWSPSRGERKRLGSKVVHGTRGAVDAHREAGHRFLDKACLRWLDVQSRKENT